MQLSRQQDLATASPGVLTKNAACTSLCLTSAYFPPLTQMHRSHTHTHTQSVSLQFSALPFAPLKIVMYPVSWMMLFWLLAVETGSDHEAAFRAAWLVATRLSDGLGPAPAGGSRRWLENEKVETTGRQWQCHTTHMVHGVGGASGAPCLPAESPI